MTKYENLAHEYVKNHYYEILREPEGQLSHKFIVPGSVYAHTLWDWDSWLTDIAITQIACEEGTLAQFTEYQKGSVNNFLDQMDLETGWIPIMVSNDSCLPYHGNAEASNCIKPILVQHAMFISKTNNDYLWLEPAYDKMINYISYYETNCLHESGLYFFIDDVCIGVDNDPCTFFRPKRSSASIFLNCLMYRELLALSALAEKLEKSHDCYKYAEKAKILKENINRYCYDERNGFYYSVDLNLVPIDQNKKMHSGCPRNWNTLIQRIDVWSGFMAMWAGIANQAQAERMVKENYLRKDTFYAKYGIRTLSKCEKMYQIVKSGNPSCWLGPIWGVSNYFVFRALEKYGYTDLAAELVDKTVKLLGRDVEECGQMHEYYDPETGAGINNQGFQSWNLLIANMIAWKNNKMIVEEF